MVLAAIVLGTFASAQHDGPEQAQQRAAQTRPFNVYNSGYHCVYIASNQAGIAIAVTTNPGVIMTLDGVETPPCE